MIYDQAGDLVEVTDEDPDEPDRVTLMDYDAMGRMLSRTDPLGRLTCWKRQADGLVSALSTPRGTKGAEGSCPNADHRYDTHTTSFDYNAVGELTSRSIPYDAARYGGRDDVKDWKVTYDRDVVGNPTTITDARGNAITNTFYDTGDLRSTSRPSFWQLDWNSDAGNPEAGERFGGTDAADIDVSVDGPTLSEREGRSANAERSGELPDKPESLGKGDLGAVSAQQLPSWLPQAGQTGLRYDDEMRLTDVVDIDQQARRIGYDNAGRVSTKSWPLDERRIEHDFGYDANGNLERVTEDWRTDDRVVTTFDYDGYDRRITEDTEGAHPTQYAGTPQREITRFAYDANDNLVRRTTPRATAFGYTYDSLDQMVSETNPAGESWRYDYDRFGDLREEEAPRAAGSTKHLYTTYSTYDKAAQLTNRTRQVDRPGENPSTLVWDFEYDGDGNRELMKAPGAPDQAVSKVEHDGRGLPWRSTVSGGSSTNAVKRISITEYDANANVRRQINPAGIDQATGLRKHADTGANTAANLDSAAQDATVRVYDSDDLQIAERLPWRGATDERYVREVEREHPQGWVTAMRLPRELSASTVFRTTYNHNRAGWITSASDETRANKTADELLPAAFRYEYDEQGNQTRWRSEHASINDEGRDLRWVHWPNGLVKRRTAAKTIDRAGSTDDTTSRRSYEYLYNSNRSLVRAIDCDARRDGQNDATQPTETCSATSPQARQTLFVRDDAERETRIDEQWTDGRDVLLTYDTGRTGWLTARRTDGALSGDSYTGTDAKSTTFAYDSLGRETSMTVNPARGADRVTQTRWHDGGALRKRTKPNGTVDTWTFNALGEKTLHERIRSGQSSDPAPQSYAYDANGNRERDERGVHGFNARDQLVKWTRPSDRGRNDRRGWSTTYTLTGAGAQGARTERNASGTVKQRTDFELDGDRLQKATTVDSTQAVAVTTTQNYRYDDAGNVQRIYSTVSSASGVPVQQDPPDNTALDPVECEADDLTASTKTTRYCYDEFNRQVFAAGSALTPSYVSYDGLDRRDRKTRKDKITNLAVETRDYSYIGTSELLSSESITTAGLAPSTKRHFYDYDSQGDRQGQQTAQGTTSSYRAYAKDANGSTVGLERTDGIIAATERYDYDPYGELDRQPAAGTSGDDPDAGLSDAAKANPFRFEGFYYDSGVKTYDMHARHYRPDTGRFLSRDTYASAAGDQALQADPLTQNRYAFAGGNPVSNVEFDGHHDLPIIGHGTKGVGKALQHRNCHAAGGCGGRMFRDNRGQALPKRQIRALRKLDRATPGNLTSTLRPTATRHPTNPPTKASDGGLLGGGKAAVSELFGSVTDPFGTVASVIKAVMNPVGTVKALAASCDGHSAGYCITYSAGSVFGAKGTGALRRGGPSDSPATKGGSRLSEASASAFRAADDPGSIFIKNKHLATAGGNNAKFEPSRV